MSQASYTLHAGNCLEVLLTLADQSLDVTIADPPYEEEAHGSQRKIDRSLPKGTKGTVNKPLSFPPITEEERVEVSRQIVRITKRWVLVFCQIEAADKWRECLKNAGARYVRTGIWVKPDPTPQLTGDRPGVGYETIVIAHVGKGRMRWNGHGLPAVWTFVSKSAEREWLHPTEKPLALLLELVRLFSDEGETILDPYAGSATTGVAAIRLGRPFVGCELDVAMADVARERLLAESRGLSHRDYRSGQQGLFAGLLSPPSPAPAGDVSPPAEPLP